MAAPHPGTGFSCTLDAPAFRVREEELRGLFARALRAVERVDDRSASFVFDAECEPELRDVLAREQRCCSFFDFEVGAADDGAIAVAVRVPAGSEPALAFLLDLTAQRA